MRFVVIYPRHRKAFDTRTPCPIDFDYITRWLGSDDAVRFELAPDVDLYTSQDPRQRRFKLFDDGPNFTGNGFLVGRSKQDEVKSLPRWLSFEAITAMLRFPNSADARRPIELRPAGLPLSGLVVSESYHGLAPKGRGDPPYIMQMYG